MVVRRVSSVIFVALAIAACDSGSPPDLKGLTDQTATVGHELAIELDGTDPDGDRLEYSVKADIALVGVPTITQTPSGAGMFRWTPLAGDAGMHAFDFTVSDGSHSTTVSITIDVREAVGSAPIFRQPLGTGTVVDVSKTPCVNVDILVEDSDTAMVDIAQEPPVIDNALFNQIDGTSAMWMWCPTPEQVAAQSRYTLVLSADDHDNPKTIKNFVIVISNGGGGTSQLVLNELDYDNIGTDTAEYIELYNAGTGDAPLAGLAVVLVNGANNAEYSRIDISSIGTLAAGGYLVIAGSGVTVSSSATKLGTAWTQDAIQNGSPDGIAIIDTVTSTLVDALAYKGGISMAVITGFPAPVSLVEGTVLPTSVGDSNTNQGTLCRNPNGQDTNNAATDWKFCTKTSPGTANMP